MLKIIKIVSVICGAILLAFDLFLSYIYYEGVWCADIISLDTYIFNCLLINLKVIGVFILIGLLCIVIKKIIDKEKLSNERKNFK